MRTLALAVTATAATAAGCVTAIDVPAPVRPTTRERAPGFALTSHQQHTVRLGEALAHGHVVLVFYRGHW